MPKRSAAPVRKGEALPDEESMMQNYNEEKLKAAKQLILDNLWHREMGQRLLTCSRYVDFIYDHFGKDPFAFVTINLNPRNVQRYIENQLRNNTAIVTNIKHLLAIGSNFYKSIRAHGIDAAAAYQTLIDKFLLNLNRRLLGTRFTRFHHPLRAFATLENEGKRYTTSGVTHCHLFIQIPIRDKDRDASETYRRFIETASTLFAEQIYVPFGKQTIGEYTATVIAKECNDDLMEDITKKSNRTALDITICGPRHPTYVMKQIPTLEIAADRIYFPRFAGRNNSDRAATV